MSLEIHEAGRPLVGILRYISAEHSFKFDVGEPEELFERAGPEGVTSLSVGTLQIEVGVASGVALFAWGLHPRANWEERSIGTPGYRAGVVRVSDPSALSSGVSREIAPVGAWPTFYDTISGWIAVQKLGDSEDEDRILIANDVVLGICQNQVRSIWLHPVFDS